MSGLSQGALTQSTVFLFFCSNQHGSCLANCKIQRSPAWPIAKSQMLHADLSLLWPVNDAVCIYLENNSTTKRVGVQGHDNMRLPARHPTTLLIDLISNAPSVTYATRSIGSDAVCLRIHWIGCCLFKDSLDGKFLASGDKQAPEHTKAQWNR